MRGMSRSSKNRHKRLKKLRRRMQLENHNEKGGHVVYSGYNYSGVSGFRGGFRGDCHVDPKKILELGNCNIYCSSSYSSNLSTLRPDVIIDLSGWFQAPVKVIGPGFENLQAVACASHVRINWPDYSTPAIGARSFAALFNDLKAIEGDVLIACTGGHGRTGTLAAILIGLSGIAGGRNPIKYLREIYCERAVENDSQIDFVYKCCNFDPTTDPLPEPVQESRAGQGNLPLAAYRKMGASSTGVNVYDLQISDDSMRAYHNALSVVDDREGVEIPVGPEPTKSRYLDPAMDEINETLLGGNEVVKEDGVYRQSQVYDIKDLLDGY